MLLRLCLYHVFFASVVILASVRNCTQFVNFSLLQVFFIYLSDLLQNIHVPRRIVFGDVFEVGSPELWIFKIDFRFWTPISWMLSNSSVLRNASLNNKKILSIIKKIKDLSTKDNSFLFTYSSVYSGIWKGERWELDRFMLVLYCISFWKLPPMMFYPSYQNGGKILSIEKPLVRRRWLRN